MPVITSEQVAQYIYVMHSLHPNDTLSVTMARLPYTMLTKVLALAYGNSVGIFSSDKEKDTLQLSPAYLVNPDAISTEIQTVLMQMSEMAMRYAENEEHVSVGQFCVWAQVGPEFFPLIKAYAEKFYDEHVAFYELEDPYSTRGNVEEFIATPNTVKEQWGAKQFKPSNKQLKKDKKNKK